MPPRKPRAAPRNPDGLEAKLQRLDEIVASLERGDLELDDALAVFEEGVARLREAQQALRAAELRIERLLEDGSGGIVVEPMPGRGE